MGYLVEHWHFRIGKFYFGFWRDDDLGYTIDHFVSKYDKEEYYYVSMGKCEIRWYKGYIGEDKII